MPSVDVMKKRQKYLQELVGVKTILHTGAFWHPYYVNDLGAIIAQVSTCRSDSYRAAHQIPLAGNGQSSRASAPQLLSRRCRSIASPSVARAALAQQGPFPPHPDGSHPLSRLLCQGADSAHQQSCLCSLPLVHPEWQVLCQSMPARIHDDQHTGGRVALEGERAHGGLGGRTHAIPSALHDWCCR